MRFQTCYSQCLVVSENNYALKGLITCIIDLFVGNFAGNIYSRSITKWSQNTSKLSKWILMNRVWWKKKGRQTTFKSERQSSKPLKHKFTSVPSWERRRKLFSNKTDQIYLRKRRFRQSNWHHQLRPLFSYDDGHESSGVEG